MRYKFLAAALLGLATLIHRPAEAADPVTLRIGVQKYGTLVILAQQHTLEERLKPLGITVQWTEFPGGPQLLEALSAGAIDFGTTGDAPPIFAQAASNNLVYVAVEPPAPTGEAILVPKDSPIQSLAELRGKKVALNKGSNVHFLLVQALAHAGLTPKDITPVYLTPADARAAFERGNVDAWAIWDPFLAAAQQATQARTLADGTGLATNRQFYLASRALADKHPDWIQVVTQEITKTDAWATGHQHEVAELLSPKTGLPVPILEISLARLGYGVVPVDDAVLQSQQQIADSFLKLGLIPKPITVRDAAWAPRS
jgi:sulfonate transport system substrate-binding protein